MRSFYVVHTYVKGRILIGEVSSDRVYIDDRLQSLKVYVRYVTEEW